MHPPGSFVPRSVREDRNPREACSHLCEQMMRPHIFAGEYGQADHDEQDALHEGQKQPNHAQDNEHPSRHHRQRLFHSDRHASSA